MKRISYLIAGGVIAAVLMQAGFTIAGIWTEYGLVEVLSRAEGDARYVEVAGDTMTGKLVATPTLSAATGDEYAWSLNYTVNKATSGLGIGLRINTTSTSTPGGNTLLWLGDAGTARMTVNSGGAMTIGSISATGNILTGSVGYLAPGDAGVQPWRTNGDLLLTSSPAGSGNVVVNTVDAANAFLVGTAAQRGALTAVTSNGTAVLTKNSHGLTLLAGDMAHITGATTAADKGFYQVESADANTITLDRALAGSDTNVVVKFYRDVLATFAGDGTNGMWMRSYARDKPLQIGGHVRGTPDASLAGEDVFVAGKLQAGGGVAGPVVQTAGTGVTALDSSVTLTGASGTATAYHLKPTINQSGTAGYTGLLIDVTETATGSGTKNLLSLTVGGSDRFRVSSGGAVTILSQVTAAQFATTWSTPGTSGALRYAGTITAGGEHYGLNLVPTYNQSAQTGAINTDLRINRTETSLGTTPGAQSLIWAGVGGAQRFRVASNGDLLVAGDIEVEGTVETNAIVSLTTDADLVLSGAGTGVVQIDDLCEITNALSVDNIASLTADTDLTLVGTGTGTVLIDDTCDISGLLSVDGISSRTDNTNLTLAGKGTGIVQVNDDLDAVGNITAGKRILAKKGSDVASANDITLGDGNFFVVTGTTETKRIAKAGWTAGSRVLLKFAGIVQVTHGVAADATYAGVNVSGGADYTSAANSIAETIYDGTSWYLAPAYTP